ncbi:MAG: flagellar hook capping FlgD N-terminal domain-containing protein [Synergistota bacterium]|nr:flagellar hook capping FlgD N-terminal domain-containing protein [Synergistota bacterium]
MDINQVSSYTGTTTSGTAREPKSTMDKDDFLLLYIEQLKNQDPMDPMDTNEMSSQMSQFSTLEQLVNMNETMETIADQNMMSSLGYIGFQVSYTVESLDAEGNTVTDEKSGVVASIKKKDGTVYLKMLDGTEVDSSKVFAVELPQASSEENA